MIYFYKKLLNQKRFRLFSIVILVFTPVLQLKSVYCQNEYFNKSSYVNSTLSTEFKRYLTYKATSDWSKLIEQSEIVYDQLSRCYTVGSSQKARLCECILSDLSQYIDNNLTLEQVYKLIFDLMPSNVLTPETARAFADYNKYINYLEGISSKNPKWLYYSIVSSIITGNQKEALPQINKLLSIDGGQTYYDKLAPIISSLQVQADEKQAFQDKYKMQAYQDESDALGRMRVRTNIDREKAARIKAAGKRIWCEEMHAGPNQTCHYKYYDINGDPWETSDECRLLGYPRKPPKDEIYASF